jgi:hypothetical protein
MFCSCYCSEKSLQNTSTNKKLKNFLSSLEEEYKTIPKVYQLANQYDYSIHAIFKKSELLVIQKKVDLKNQKTTDLGTKHLPKKAERFFDPAAVSSIQYYYKKDTLRRICFSEAHANFDYVWDIMVKEPYVHVARFNRSSSSQSNSNVVIGNLFCSKQIIGQTYNGKINDDAAKKGLRSKQKLYPFLLKLIKT